MKIVIGRYPLRENTICQFETKAGQSAFTSLLNDVIELACGGDIWLMPECEEEDQAVSFVIHLSALYNAHDHQGKRLTCYLMLHSYDSIRMLQYNDLCKGIRNNVDVYPFVIDEVWSRNIVLDRIPITLQSEKRVHLVIFGMDDTANIIAMQAAHIAHYPNYVRDHSLRTRITMVDTNAEALSNDLIKRYRHLFDNSYYRVVKPSEEKAVVSFHKPMYEGEREDFVDVEWEFVAAESWNTGLREKLQLWAKDQNQILTVVMAHKHAERNINEACHLPQEVFDCLIPIYIYGQEDIKIVNCPNIRSFCTSITRHDTCIPLIRMAKNVNYIYERCYHENDRKWNGKLRYTVEIDPQERDRLWAELPNIKRLSNIYNAMTIRSKMRSVGLEENDWDQFYDIPQQDIELLAQVEHNRWSVEKLIMGFRPCNHHEQEVIASDVKNLKEAYKTKRIHYDLRAYNDLRSDGTGKPVQIYDLCLSSCLPLIAKDSAILKGEGE